MKNTAIFIAFVVICLVVYVIATGDIPEIDDSTVGGDNG